MPLDPKFETSAGLQRFREQIFRENRSRLFHGGDVSPAARQFLTERKKRLAAEGASTTTMGSRGTAGRSGIVSSTQRNVVDEGYDMVLKSEWGAACEGVNAEDPMFKELNADHIGDHARTLCVMREGSARAVSVTRHRMEQEKVSEHEWAERAHHIVDDGWVRARREGGISNHNYSASRNSGFSDLTTIKTEGGAQLQAVKSAPETMAYQAAIGHGPALARPQKKGIGLASAGVRAPTYTASRFGNLCDHMRGVYAKPPPPKKDIFAALEHVTKMSMPRKQLDDSAPEVEKADRVELERRVDALQKKLVEERTATNKMADKLEAMTHAAAAATNEEGN